MSGLRHEYYDGEISAMTRTSYNHNRIAVDFARAAANSLDGSSCEVFAGDARVCTPDGLYTYPDVMIVCGGVEFTADRLETSTNPVVIVEVLSKSTRLYDKGQKFDSYKRLETLREYILIEQTRVYAEQHSKDEQGSWTLEAFEHLHNILNLSSVKARIKLSDLYRRVNFNSPDAEDSKT